MWLEYGVCRPGGAPPGPATRHGVDAAVAAQLADAGNRNGSIGRATGAIFSLAGRAPDLDTWQRRYHIGCTPEKPGFTGFFRCSPRSETEWLKTRKSGVDKAWRRGLYTAQHGAPTLRRDGAPPKLLTDSGGRNSDQTRRIKFRRPSDSGRVGAFGPGLFDR
jgi:hypothetical protein